MWFFKPKHGRWIEKEHFFRPVTWQCSNCRREFPKKYKECPMCDAIMDQDDLSFEEQIVLADELFGDEE